VKKVACLGEILIDFTASEKGKPLSDVESFIKNPGGSPPNTAVAISMLGGNVSFISKISTDSFGKFLYRTIKKFNINTEGIVRTEAPTCLAFVSIKEDGIPDFEFYREKTADTLLKKPSWLVVTGSLTSSSSAILNAHSVIS
jgi:fructokinase